MSARSAAARFGIGISTAIAWIANARQGQLTAGKQGRRSGSRLNAHEAFIIGLIDVEKDITLNEMVVRLRTNKSVSIGRSALDVWLASGAGPLKKTAHALEQERANLLSRRQEWFDGQLDLDPAKLVFIDETGLSVNDH